MREDSREIEDMEKFRGVAGTCCPSSNGEIGRECGGGAPGEGCGDCAAVRRNAFRARTSRFVSSVAPPALNGLEKFKCLRLVEGVRPTKWGSAIGLVDNTSPHPRPYSSTTPSGSSDDTTTVGSGTGLFDRDPWYNKLCGSILPYLGGRRPSLPLELEASPLGCGEGVLRSRTPPLRSDICSSPPAGARTEFDRRPGAGSEDVAAE
jgi:hypothetical protein